MPCSCATLESDARSATLPGRIADRLREEQARVRTNSSRKWPRLSARDKRRLDAHSFEGHGELRHRATVEIRGRDDVIARLCQREHRAQLRGETARGCEGAQAAFETRHAFFERCDRWVSDARVDVAVGAQGEQFGRVLR